VRELARDRGTAQDAVEAARVESLQAEAKRARTAAENRFAGITLTGRRVLFLVDTSGSMERIDRDTPDAAKWGESARRWYACCAACRTGQVPGHPVRGEGGLPARAGRPLDRLRHDCERETS
jgi:hypothetical protein